ncbi:MAG TPA: hypothetical protein DEP53_10295, partial [Bacteroidetes bacterium]|nr:hypothetical protein [Bacteroidota bacterium]
VFTGITAAMTAFCITNPKACFGSCPTFYVSDGDTMRLQAEGFSSSIAPSLEAADVDALYHGRSNNGTVNIVMRNEALETHVVRYVDLLVVPRKEACRVFSEGDRRFWESTSVNPPLSAQAPEGDCLPLVRNADGIERFSRADETYLGAKETLDLAFRVRPDRSYGLVIACRQTLLPTYMLYQAFAYMGSDVGHWLAQMERKAVPKQYSSMELLLGGIEAMTRGEDGQWKIQGAIDEHGPLATDVHIISLSTLRDSTLSVRLRMTKGTWRIDYVALAELSQELQPVRLRPRIVLRNNQEDSEALALLLDSSKVLVTLPGDTYTLAYNLPDSYPDYELFLESRGYYLEWIRKEWIDEQDPMYLAEMFLTPESALRRMTKEFNRVEAQMEDCFWRSRYAKQ